MAFKFHQLDAIYDVDEGLTLIEQAYAPQLTDRFAQSPEGQAYLAAHSEEKAMLATGLLT